MLLALVGVVVWSGHRIWMPPLAVPAAALAVVVALLGLVHAQRPRRRPRALVGLLVSVIVLNLAMPSILVMAGRIQIPHGCKGGIVARDWVRNEVTCQYGGPYGEVIRVDHDFVDFIAPA